MIERLSFGAVDETLENNRTILNSGDRARCNGQIVACEIELRDSCMRKIQLVGMRDADFTPLEREHRAGRFICHSIRLPP